MKVLLAVFAMLLVVTTVSLAVIVGGAHHVGVLGAMFGLFVAAVAVAFAMVITVVALAGAFLGVLFALVMAGLILLACAMPFLLPLIVPLALIFIVVLATRRSKNRQQVT